MSFITNFVQWNPLVSVIIFSFIITFLLTIMYKKLTDQKKVQEINQKQKELRDKMKEYKNQPEKMMEIQKEMIQYSAESIKLSFKPMIISSIPMIIVLGLLNKLYTGLQVGKIFIIPLLGIKLNWFWTYVVFSFIFNIALQKVMKAKQPGPL